MREKEGLGWGGGILPKPWTQTMEAWCLLFDSGVDGTPLVPIIDFQYFMTRQIKTGEKAAALWASSSRKYSPLVSLAMGDFISWTLSMP